MSLEMRHATNKYSRRYNVDGITNDVDSSNCTTNEQEKKNSHDIIELISFAFGFAEAGSISK